MERNITVIFAFNKVIFTLFNLNKRRRNPILQTQQKKWFDNNNVIDKTRQYFFSFVNFK